MSTEFSSQECLNKETGVNDTIQANLIRLTSHTNPEPTAITQIAVKGGVIRNIDQATGDIARTTSGWIEDEKYGWYAIQTATAWSAEFDSVVTRTGRLTLKLSNTDTTGRVTASNITGTNPTTVTGANIRRLSPMKASTLYKFSCLVKTSNVANDSVFLELVTFDSAFTTRENQTTNKLTGDNDWTELTVTFTSGADRAWAAINLRNITAGNISDAWFDVNSMTLEEVATINNPLSTPVKLYPKFTAVDSTDNIDQSQVVSDNSSILGNVSGKYRSQQFLPTKKNYVSYVIRKGTGLGTYTGDVTFSIRTNNVDKPSVTDVGTPVVVTNAVWQALTADTDYTITIPCTLTVDGSTTYWILATSSTADDSNYTALRTQGTGGYSGGVSKYSQNFTSWTTSATDLYFKTLYSKNTTNVTARTDTQSLSINSPTVEGWTNGTVIDTTLVAPTFPGFKLAPGDNTFYLSSNGSTTADSSTDESLQVLMDGVIGENINDATIQDLANEYAGTTGLSTQEALNVKAGTTGLTIQEALNIITA